MTTLLQAGMPILQAIEVSGRTVSNGCLAEEILGTLPGVEGGRSLGECLSYTKELPPMLVQLTSVGEATGSMEDTLKVLAEYYDSEVDLRTKRDICSFYSYGGLSANVQYVFFNLIGAGQASLTYT